MTNKTKAAPERKTFVVIRSGRKMAKLEAWKYWEIVGELQWVGATRPEATDAAKWIQKHKPGEKLTLPSGIVVELVEKEGA